MLDEGAHVRQFELFVRREILRGELRVRHQHFAQPISFAVFTKRENFARGPRCPVARIMSCLLNQLQARRAAAESLPFASITVMRRRIDARGRQFQLDLRPERQLRVGAVRTPGGFVGRVHRRHPNNLAAGTPRQFDRHRIQSAHAVVQRDGAVGADPRNGFGDHLRALGGREIVRLQHESLQPVRQEFLGQVQIVDAPLDHIRRHVHLQIVGALAMPPTPHLIFLSKSGLELPSFIPRLVFSTQGSCSSPILRATRPSTQGASQIRY